MNNLKEWTWNSARAAGVLPVEWLDLRGSDLIGSNLRGSDLIGSNLRGSDLSDCNLIGSNLSRSDLRDCDLRGSDLIGSNLRGSNLRGSDLSDCNLIGSNLSRSDLRDCDLIGSDLSGATGLLSAAAWLRDNFASNDRGIIVYKRIGKTEYDAPASWTIEPGSVITEICNPTRTQECGCGVNFGTLDWCKNHYLYATIWECLIEWIDLAGVVVPYNTDGKARCERMTLLREYVETEQ